MEDDYRVVDWPEFEPKNKTWKGALEINELKGESTIEFMLWRKETLIRLSTQNLVHHLFLDKIPTGEPVLIKFEEEMEDVTKKMDEAEKKRFLVERKELEARHKEKLEYKQQINQRRFDDRMDNQMNLTNLLNKACVGRAKGYLSDLKRRTPKLIWDTLTLNLSTVIAHNVKEAKSKLEDCCIGENESISSFELRLKELFLHVEALKGKPIPMNKKLDYIRDSMPQHRWKTFRGLLRVGEWTVESAFLELKQIEGSRSSANKKKQALKTKENAAAYVAFRKKNNSAANPNQQGNVAPPRQGRQGNGPPRRSPLIPSPQTCNQFRSYPGWEDPPTPPAKACFRCGATSHIVKGCNTNPANQSAVGQQAKVNFDAFVQKINAWKMKMNKINIPVYSCCVSALVSSSQSSIQSAFVAKQSNGATALADSACSNTIVNDPNLTTRNAPPAMTINIKQANGNLIPVTMQGDLAIHPDLPPLQDVSVVPNCEMNLLSVAHMCETWDASVVLDSDQIRVTKKKINLSDSQTILSGPQNNGLYYLALPSRTNHQQSYIAEEVTHPKNETPEDASSSQPLRKKRIRRTLCPTREKE